MTTSVEQEFFEQPSVEVFVHAVHKFAEDGYDLAVSLRRNLSRSTFVAIFVLVSDVCLLVCCVSIVVSCLLA